MKLVAGKVRPFVVVGLVNVITNESLDIAKESNKLNGRHLQTSIATNFAGSQ